MAKVDLAKAVEAIHGKVGNLLFKHVDGRQRVMPLPNYSGKPLPVQLEAQKPVMRNASLTWHNLKQDHPEVAAAYRARASQLQRQVFALFYADLIDGPQVKELRVSQDAGQPGSRISVLATDRFEVRGVQVTIRGATGQVLEIGSAQRIQTGEDWWVYTVQSPTTMEAGTSIEAIAVNWAGTQNSRVQLLHPCQGASPTP